MAHSPQPKSWRDALPVHPAADLFPHMSESAASSARTSGLTVYCRPSFFTTGS
jgi:hypothetical protein